MSIVAISSIQKYFSRVETPRFLNSKIQKLALSHLKLRDVGGLRDRFEGQLYLDQLTEAIRAEYAFESFLGLNFDWKKRETTDYQRLTQFIANSKIQLATFNLNKLPTINEIIPTVLVFLKPDKYAYIGPILFEEQLSIIKCKNVDPLNNKTIINLNELNFETMKYIKDYDDLLNVLK
ncbi:hypothetical protein ACFOSV_12700 [Algoriphagus namhaensis]|uniref:Uncharacterized protein n=1 Tax=Algoriphagus namhaensis TaxID=915353 RepID=A0ABV8ATS1_9BACT